MKDKIIIVALMAGLITSLTHTVYKSKRIRRAGGNTAIVGGTGTTGRLIPFSLDLLESNQQAYYNKLDAAGKQIYQQAFDDGRERIIKRFGIGGRGKK